MSDHHIYGRVILVGAGPGDPELITAKAIRYLSQADIVLTDRLVSDDILRNYVNPRAEVIYVGKQCRRGFSTPQVTINQLLVECALEKKLVVRLKGGDVSIFSNILDELETLVANNIPYEIVPGVTAALGAAATAAIPLTARGYSTAVRLLTLYKSDVVTDDYWMDLAKTRDTLVFYMSAETVNLIVAKLIHFGIGGDIQIAVIEQATTPLQNVHTARIHDFPEVYGNKVFLSPSLVIIGKVVGLHEQFAWMESSPGKEEYFKPGAFIHKTSQADLNIKQISRA